MVISIEKTKAMLITSRHKNYRLTEAQRDLNINLHGNTIISTKQEKLLGILIDNNLAWHPQVKKVRKPLFSEKLENICQHQFESYTIITTLNLI